MWTYFPQIHATYEKPNLMLVVWAHFGSIFPFLNKAMTRSCAVMPKTGESISDYISYFGIRACQASTGSMPNQQAIF